LSRATSERVDDLIDAHQRACDGFQAVADQVPDDKWGVPTPCTEWDARALVEHVIGFHEFLLIRPLGARAHRPREGPADRWRATATALFDALSEPDALDRETELPGGGTSSPRTMLASLTNDVVAHHWDLARATGIDLDPDPDLVARAWEIASSDKSFGGGGDMFDPAVQVPEDAPVLDKLVARYGRDPAWSPPHA
jgi:uncharacterized protein (TIGR03086 family)